MNSIKIPKVITIDLRYVLEQLRNYFVILNNGVLYKFDSDDINNIIMDLVRGLDSNTHGVFIGILKINHLLDNASNKNDIVFDLNRLLDSSKMNLIELVNTNGLGPILSMDGGEFNFYLREIRGSIAILEYLNKKGD